MYKYTVLECKDCKHREMYPSNTADGHKCKVCGSTIYIPIDTGLKVEMQGKYNIAYEPRQDREVTTTEYELLLKRFRHLMKSETIASFDEVDPRTGEYKRDIKELDKKTGLKIGIEVDTRGLDRLAIGGRLYDALTWNYDGDRINLYSILQRDKETGDILIMESDLMKLIKLATPEPTTTRDKHRPVRRIRLI